MRRKNTNRFVVLLGLILTSVGVNHAQAGGCGTVVPAGSVVGAHWTLAGSPYCVTGDIDLIGVVIDPGVEVLVDGDFTIEFVGNVTAAGTAEQPILFTEKDEDDNWNGIAMNNAFPPIVLQYCIIEKSDAGGLGIVDSTPVLEHCVITHNTNPANGGGIHATMTKGALVIEECIIENNTSNPTNAFVDRVGGGIYVSGDCVLTRCIVRGNSVFSNRNPGGPCGVDPIASGGGIYAINGSLTLATCVIHDNIAKASESLPCGNETTTSRGGGVFFSSASNTLSANNCLVYCNRSTTAGSSPTRHGSGIYIGAGTATIDNCTFARNGDISTINDEALWATSSSQVTVINTIAYWNNQTSSGPDVFGDQLGGPGLLAVTYSNVQNGYTGEGNIDFNPGFFGDDCSCPDYRITPFSPCVDAGSPLEKFNDGCLGPGLGSTTNDMGAHGGPLNCNWDCWIPADLDCDGAVGVKDLLALLGQWGPCPDPPDDCPADINCDGAVGVKDLLQLLGNWG